MLSVFALMLVGCSNPANSGPSDPYLLGLDDCEVTLAAIEAGVQDGWQYECITVVAGNEPYTSTTNGYVIKRMQSSLSDNNCTDFKYYANADFSTIVMKYKNYGADTYIQYIKK